ncbi:MAG: BatD family protein [Vicingaceae bacterium]|nr:BatD family protein [Vicingaceae bacterium]
MNNPKNIALKIILLLSIVVACNTALAQGVDFTAVTSHSAVATGDRFQIEFKVNSKISNFTPPDLSNFRVLSGPNQSTNMSWVNGQTSTSLSYSYILMAIKEGDFTIQPASVVVNGKTYKSNTISIKVGKGIQIQQQQQQNQQSKTQINASEELQIKASVNKTTVYQGEQLVATYKLYTKIGIAGNELIKNAALNGFWSQEIDLGQTQWTEEVIGGYRWHVATIRKIVLFPQRSGNLEIDPIEMRFVTQKRVSGGQSVFEQFFGRVVEEEHILKSKPIKINVLPHPEPKPADFINAVGKLDMKVDVSANEVKANEAINIKIKISGNGNLPLIDKINIDFPKDFEVYDPKITDNTSTTSNGVSGTKEYDYLIIPRYPGNYNINPISFSYFDPATKKYATITSNPLTFKIQKGDGSAANMTYSSGNKEDIKLLGEDIRFIHTNNLIFINPNDNFYGSWKFYLLMILAPLLFILTFIFRNKIRAANSDLALVNSRKANKLAIKLLASAEKSLKENNKNAFYEAVSKALFGYIGNKLNISTSELTQNNIKEKLLAKSVSETTIKELIDTLDLCDMARFAPVPVAEQTVYESAKNSIQKLEKEVVRG